MLSRAETILILKAVPLFTETPDEILTEVVGLLEGVEVKAGEPIFHKGDLGNCMYIVVDGRVRVHDRELTLHSLGKHTIFGELALLAPERRLAAVTALEDTQLLRLAQEPFYTLLAHRLEVVRSVIQLLVQYVRTCNRDLTAEWEYIQQVARITAAASALEAGLFQPERLEEVTRRTDELGQLARVFQRMAHEVYAREQQLRQEVQQLRIEIDAMKTTQQVAEITETAYFQDLQNKVNQWRRGKAPEP